MAARQELVLKIIVQEYIAKAVPVASETLVRNYRLGISPATVRNYMARLEEQGYLSRPHASAGSVPLAKAYRYYVQSLASDLELSPAEQRLINKLFEESEGTAEEWVRLAASLLARLARNTALVTMPKAPTARLKHVELVSLADRLALLIVVLHEIRIKQQLLNFKDPVTQDELSRIANKFNTIFGSMTGGEIRRKKVELLERERYILDAVLTIIDEQDRKSTERPYLEGLRLMLNQPEFLPSGRMLNIMELMENLEWLSSIISRQSKESDVNVLIGEESQQDALRDLSVVFGRYGIPDDIGGTIGVLGPTRMDYRHSIAAVRYFCQVLSNLLMGLYQQQR
ncbi:MAG: heat-inducible transcriptional repressor HrcA [Dehalococcoidia bacterium]|nr:heat-inducible transcriptional repressor HrcA [Dehalococcoidia bacterium]